MLFRSQRLKFVTAQRLQQVGELLQELTAETREGTREALRLVRRLKIKLGQSVPGTNRMTGSNSCSLAKALGNLPRLEYAEVNEMLLAGRGAELLQLQ